MSLEYLGVSADGWAVVFDAVRTIAIVTGLAFGAYQLQELRRQRTVSSMEKMLEEWRSDAQCRDRVLRLMPLSESADDVARTVDLAANLLAQQHVSPSMGATSLGDALRAARLTVRQLNDLGAYLEHRGVSERAFFGHFHVRILELEYLLRPYYLLVSALRGNRWGFRLRRLAIGAARYHRSERVHADMRVAVRGRIILDSSEEQQRHGWRRAKVSRLLPPKEDLKQQDDDLLGAACAALDQSEIDLDEVRRLLDELTA